jgi:hypothetical protein
MWHEVDPHDPFALRRRLIEELWRSALLHRLILAFGELRPFGQPRDAPSSCGPPLGDTRTGWVRRRSIKPAAGCAMMSRGDLSTSLKELLEAERRWGAFDMDVTEIQAEIARRRVHQTKA